MYSPRVPRPFLTLPQEFETPSPLPHPLTRAHNYYNPVRGEESEFINAKLLEQ